MDAVEGRTFDAIGQAMGVPLDTVYAVVARHGGVPPPVTGRARRTR